MGTKTKIEWTDATWNPIRGCSVVSEGCRNCYAMQVAARFSQRYWEVWQGSTLICSAKQKLTEAAARNKVENESRNAVVMEARESSEGQAYEGLAYRNESGAHWTGKVRLIEEHLEDPLRWKRPRRIFVNSMSDLFHPLVLDQWIEKIFNVMFAAKQHTFQILTKRPERMLDWISRSAFLSNAPLENVWLGVSVENQKTADERIPLLLETPAAVRWVSAEPLLGPIDLEAFVTDPAPQALRTLSRYYSASGFDRAGGQTEKTRVVNSKLGWLVAGGESGSGARPMHPDWVRYIRDQCATAGVPFFFKQWGAWGPVTHYSMRGTEHPTLPTYQTDSFEVFPLSADRFLLGPMLGRVGKKAAGNLLDGRQHLEYPA
jgi:protein gp37